MAVLLRLPPVESGPTLEETAMLFGGVAVVEADINDNVTVKVQVKETRHFFLNK